MPPAIRDLDAGFVGARLGVTPNGDRARHARSLDMLGEVLACQGDDARAEALREASLALRRSLGDNGGIPYALKNLGELACRQGAFARALALGEASLAMVREQGDRWGSALALHLLGRTALELGEHDRTDSRRSLCL